MRRSMILCFFAFIYLPSCNKNENPADFLSPSPAGELSFRELSLEDLKTQFKTNLSALLILQSNALKSAVQAQQVVVPSQPTEADVAELQEILIGRGFLNEETLLEKAGLVNADLQLLSAAMTRPELLSLIQSQAYSALAISAGSGPSSLPCYDDYEASMLLAASGLATCLYFSGGIAGAVVCAGAYVVTAIIVEDQFNNCIQNTYPGANY